MKGPVTYNIALQIIEQEVEYEEDLQALLENFELMIRAMRKKFNRGMLPCS